jgi:hypothetical protein
LTSLDSSSAIAVTCTYVNAALLYSSQVYRCIVGSKQLFDGSRQTITAVSGRHRKGMDVTKVNGIEFSGISNMHLMPRGIDVVFPRTVFIYVTGCNLREITKDDLKPFPQLKYLNIDNNNIKVIESQLFMHNPRLEVIWIRPNPIEHIDPHVFSGLNKLKDLFIGKCAGGVDFGDAHGWSDVDEMVLRVENEECTSICYKESMARNEMEGLKEQVANLTEANRVLSEKLKLY